MASVSSSLPIGKAGMEAGQLPGKRRLGDMFRAAMAAAMSAAADLSFGSAGPIVSGETGPGPDAFTVDAGSLGLGVLGGTSWEFPEAGQGFTGKAEAALPHLYPGRTPGEPRAEAGVTSPVLGFPGAVSGEKPQGETGEVSPVWPTTDLPAVGNAWVSDPASAAGTQVTYLRNGRGAANGVDALAGEYVSELGDEAPVVLRLLSVPADHALQAEPLEGASLTMARLTLENPDAVSPEVTSIQDSATVLEGAAETRFGDIASGTLESRPLLPGDSLGQREVVAGRVTGVSRQTRGSLQTEDIRQTGESQETGDAPETGNAPQEGELSKVTGTSRAMILQPAMDTGTTEDAARAAGGVAVTAQREISRQDIRALAEHLREEALKRLPRTVQIRLDPPRLGTITAVLSARGQEIAVKFVASTAEAGRALDASQGDLAKGLFEQGLTLAGFAVDQRSSGDGMPRGERGRTVPTGGRTGRRGTQVKTAPILAVGAAGTSHLGNVSRGYLDYIV